MKPLAEQLADAFLAGAFSIEAMTRRGAQALGQRPRWLRGLARRAHAAFASTPNIEVNTVARFIAADSTFQKNASAVYASWQQQDPARRIFWSIPETGPAPTMPLANAVPPLATTAELADWLDLEPGELDWFADCGGWEAGVREPKLRHYSYRWVGKSRGSARLLEMPKQRLKAIHRQILRDILNRIPPHDAAHGYRPGRSVIGFVRPHAARDIVLHFDLRNFFPSVRAARVYGLFRTIGYPTTVARYLTGLCTNIAPAEAWLTQSKDSASPDFNARNLYRLPHLPQGAPTSPALANLCSYRFDCRLDALAKTLPASYTRYADDLAFSGGMELERAARRFQVAVCRIALEEGFEIHTRKSRFMRQGVRQQLAGIVLNVRPNLRRDEFDRLKAILHNCIKNGGQAENRENVRDFRGHLLGRISYISMIHPARGRRLREMFDEIEWDGTSAGKPAD
jgi:RNA-directed DNA polymerase